MFLQLCLCTHLPLPTAETWRHLCPHIYHGKHEERERERETERDRDREIERVRARETDRQTYRESLFFQTTVVIDAFKAYESENARSSEE